MHSLLLIITSLVFLVLGYTSDADLARGVLATMAGIYAAAYILSRQIADLKKDFDQ